MSTPSQNIAPLLVAEAAHSTNGKDRERVTEKTKRPRSRPYKARVATKIKWALGDINMISSNSAQPTMRRLLDWAEEERALAAGDNARLARLGKFTQDLASLALDVTEIERIAWRAQVESKEDKDDGDQQQTRGGP